MKAITTMIKKSKMIKSKLFSAISFRITAVFSIATIMILIVMGLVIHQLVTHHFDMQDRVQLQGKAQLIQNLLEQNPNNSPRLNLFLNDALVGHHDLIVQVERPLGNIIFSTSPAVIDANHLIDSSTKPLNRPLRKLEKPVWLNWHNQDKTYRVLVFNSLQSSLNQSTISQPQSVQIAVGVDTSAHANFLNSFRWQLFYIGLIGTLCLMLLGWFAAWKGLQPIQKMAQVTEGISAQHLSHRLEIKNIPTELQSLAVAFNAMLDRLELALERLSDFSSDLAHEIRTPINNLMTQTQVCLSRSRESSDYQEVLFSNLEEFERLARTVSDMLFLAKADHGIHAFNVNKVNLAEEVEALFDFYDALAAEKGISLVQAGAASIMADPAMLRRALNNLLSNAIKYGHKDSVVHIELKQSGSTAIFSIKNRAESLSPEQLSRLFDRFYRTDLSRQRIEEGTGLGLAITKSILELHEATIDAKFENGWIVFTIVFKGTEP